MHWVRIMWACYALLDLFLRWLSLTRDISARRPSMSATHLPFDYNWGFLAMKHLTQSWSSNFFPVIEGMLREAGGGVDFNRNLDSCSKVLRDAYPLLWRNSWCSWWRRTVFLGRPTISIQVPSMVADCSPYDTPSSLLHTDLTSTSFSPFFRYTAVNETISKVYTLLHLYVSSSTLFTKYAFSSTF